MKLREIAVREVSGELPSPVGSAGSAEHRRAGLLLRLEDTDGNVGLGEASPLPGFSSDSLASCRAALAGLSARDLTGCFTGTSNLLEALARAGALLAPEAPAAVFALETALLDLVCRRAQRSPFELLGRSPLPRVALNAVLDGTLPDARERALDLVQQGYTTLKFKLGARFEPALDTLAHLSERGAVRLRADANRSLGAEALERALPRLAALDLEFLEEPCAPELWPSLPQRRPPLALDETLRGVRPAELPALLRRARADVVVLKPMALGGLSACLRLADSAEAVGCAVVVTHLFDGPIALAAASVLACIVQSPKLAAGLAPHAGLATWPSAPRETSQRVELEPGTYRSAISPPGYWQAFGD